MCDNREWLKLLVAEINRKREFSSSSARRQLPKDSGGLVRWSYGFRVALYWIAVASLVVAFWLASLEAVSR